MLRVRIAVPGRHHRVTSGGGNGEERWTGAYSRPGRAVKRHTTNTGAQQKRQSARTSFAFPLSLLHLGCGRHRRPRGHVVDHGAWQAPLNVLHSILGPRPASSRCEEEGAMSGNALRVEAEAAGISTRWILWVGRGLTAVPILLMVVSASMKFMGSPPGGSGFSSGGCAGRKPVADDS